MDLTTAYTGMLPFILMVAATLTLLTSVFLLWLYRRAILRSMAQSASPELSHHTEQIAHQESARWPDQVSRKLEFEDIVDSRTDMQADQPRTVAHPAVNDIRRAQRNTAIVYITGGLMYALVMTVAVLIMTGGNSSFERAVLLMTLFAWPTVIALSIVAAVGFWEVMLLVGGYCVLLILVVCTTLIRNPDSTVLELLFLWAYFNVPPSVVFLFFLHKRVRCVGPVVFVFFLSGIAGAMLLVQLAGNNEYWLSSIVTIG